MKNFLKQYRFWLISILILTVMGLTLWFAILPMYSKVLSLRDDIQKELARKENQEKQIKRLPELKHQYETIVGEEGHLDILLTEDRVVGFIQTLEKLAETTGTEVKIQSNDSKIEEPAAKKKEASGEEGDSSSEGEKVKTLMASLPYDHYLRLTITVKGDYSEIVAFLTSLETLPVALDVVGLEVRQPIKDDSAGQGDVRPVSPFTQSIDPPTTDPAQAQASGDQAATPKENEVPAEILKPISPQLEAVFDLVVYTAKK